MRFQAGSDLPHFKVTNNQTQIRIHFYLKIIKGSSIFYNDSKCSAHTLELYCCCTRIKVHMKSRKGKEGICYSTAQMELESDIYKCLQSGWGIGLEFSGMRCRFVINICSNINVNFERAKRHPKITVYAERASLRGVTICQRPNYFSGRCSRCL